MGILYLFGIKELLLAAPRLDSHWALPPFPLNFCSPSQVSHWLLLQFGLDEKSGLDENGWISVTSTQELRPGLQIQHNNPNSCVSAGTCLGFFGNSGALLAAAWLLKGFPFWKEEKHLLMGIKGDYGVSTASFPVVCKMLELLDREYLGCCSPGRAPGVHSQEKLCQGSVCPVWKLQFHQHSLKTSQARSVCTGKRFNVGTRRVCCWLVLWGLVFY